MRKEIFLRSFFIIFLSLCTGLLSAQIPTGSFDDLQEYQDSVLSESDIIVVNYWATWCKPCKEEMKFLVESRDKYSGENVKFIFVSLDFPAQIESKMKPYSEKMNILDDIYVLKSDLSSDQIDSVNSSWSGAIPITIFKNKFRENFHEGAFRETKEINQIIKSLKR